MSPEVWGQPNVHEPQPEAAECYDPLHDAECMCGADPDAAYESGMGI